MYRFKGLHSNDDILTKKTGSFYGKALFLDSTRAYSNHSILCHPASSEIVCLVSKMDFYHQMASNENQVVSYIYSSHLNVAFSNFRSSKEWCGMFKIKDFDKIDKITHSNRSQWIWFGYVLTLS